MKSEILFLAMYPYGEDAKDGLAQRILLIDKQFISVHRTYIRISFRHFFKKEIREHDNIYSIRCNFFLHFLFIFKIIKKHPVIYLHSVYNFFLVMHFLLMFSNKKLFLDAHGLVPEELAMERQSAKAKLYQRVEKLAFEKVNGLICVTLAMQTHFSAKYPDYKGKMMVYEMLTHIAKVDKTINVLDTIYPLPVQIVYSGNMQVWQNIDLMLSLIRKNLARHIQYTILTGEPDKMRTALKRYDLHEEKNISISSVLPHELPQFYRKAHYGFILRDDNIVNRVACPTKLVEYLAFGIIPIVKGSNIGDFEELGYEYVHCTESLRLLPPQKSRRNQQVIEKLYTANVAKDVLKFVLHG